MGAFSTGEFRERTGADIPSLEGGRQLIGIVQAGKHRCIRVHAMKHFQHALGTAILGEIIVNQGNAHGEPFTAGNADWKEETEKFLEQRGYKKELVQEYVEAIEMYAKYFKRYAFLYCPNTSP